MRRQSYVETIATEIEKCSGPRGRSFTKYDLDRAKTKKFTCMRCRREDTTSHRRRLVSLDVCQACFTKGGTVSA